MPLPIGTYSPEAVIDAIEDDLVGASVSLGRTEDGVVFRGSDVTWVYTGFPALSRVLRARFTPDQAEDRVAEVSDNFKEWAAPVSWVVGPTTWPPRLGELLRAAGFDAGQVWMGLARDVPAGPADEPAGDAPRLPAGFRVDRATTLEQLAAWAAVGGGPADATPADPGPAAAAIFAPDNAGADPRCRYYLATLDGRPVARGMAHVRDDVVGLHWLAADPDHRDRGYRAAVARRALADARQTGGRLAVLPARGDAQRLGRRLGFKTYCQFHVHAWPAAATAHA